MYRYKHHSNSVSVTSKMFIRLCIILLFFALGLLAQNDRKIFEFQQSDYNVEFERMELDHYNDKNTKFVKIVTFKYNRTCAVVNASFMLKVDGGNNLQIIVQAYKFLSNEYRHFPLRFEVNLCDAFSKNLIGIAKSFKCGNFTGCPIRKNVNYNICYWTIDQSSFPPLVPNGKYMVHLQSFLFGEDVGAIRLYVTISRPIAY